MTNKSKKRPLTNEERQQAERFRREWAKAQKRFRARGEKLTQHSAAEALGMTQGALWQYLNAWTRIGPVFLLKAAIYLGFDPRVVNPRVFDQVPSAPVELGELSAKTAQIMERMGRQDQEAVLRHAEALAAAAAAISKR